MGLPEEEEFALGYQAELIEQNEKLRARIAELEAERPLLLAAKAAYDFTLTHCAGALEDAEYLEWCHLRDAYRALAEKGAPK